VQPFTPALLDNRHGPHDLLKEGFMMRVLERMLPLWLASVTKRQDGLKCQIELLQVCGTAFCRRALEPRRMQPNPSISCITSLLSAKASLYASLTPHIVQGCAQHSASARTRCPLCDQCTELDL
jgi:hypothetical protein